MTYLPYGTAEKPVRAWEVLEQEYVQHIHAGDEAQHELDSALKKVERMRQAVQYHFRAAEECLSAAAVLRETAGRPPLPENNPVAEGDR